MSSDGPQVPYMVFSSTEGCREETEAVSRVCGITITSASLPAEKSAAAVGGSGWIYQKVKCSLCYKATSN